MYRLLILSLSIFLLYSCSSSRSSISSGKTGVSLKSTVKLKGKVPKKNINTRDVSAIKVMSFAQSLKGIKYKYGSADKSKGFDCSGYITYVFNHFDIAVPRISRDFTNAGKEVSSLDSKPGDIILFTGSNPNSGEVGHMGLITENKRGVIRFIHAASGNNVGVIVSGMERYYLRRFVKIIRVFSVW